MIIPTLEVLDDIVGACCLQLDDSVFQIHREALGNSVIWMVAKAGAQVGKFKIWQHGNPPRPTLESIPPGDATLQPDFESLSNQISGSINRWYEETRELAMVQDHNPSKQPYTGGAVLVPVQGQASKYDADLRQGTVLWQGAVNEGSRYVITSTGAKWEAEPERAALPAEPPSPPPKPEGKRLDDWFEWYHAMRTAGYKCTLRDVADATNYRPGYVKQKHMEFAAERKSEPNT